VVPCPGWERSVSAFGLDAKSHAHQSVGRALLDGRVEADAVVAHRHLDLPVDGRQRHPDLAGLGVLADVGDGLLHHAVDHQLGVRLEPDRLDLAMHLHAGALGELARQDFQRRGQPQVAERGRTQVFDDAPPQRDAAVERVHQVDQAFARLGRAAGQPRHDARRIQLGRGEQRTQFVVQVARQTAAFVLARGLQVVRQLGELGGALRDFDLQPVALGLQRPLLFLLLHLQRQALAQVHEQAQQADAAKRRDPDARPHQGAIDVAPALFDA
jgi:hypothetical protein